MNQVFSQGDRVGGGVVDTVPGQLVRFNTWFPASPEQVFAFFGNHEQFGTLWPGVTRRLRAGEDPAQPDGLGSVRENRSGGSSLEETITRYEPSSLIEYRVTKGSPVKNHLGRLLFTADNGGTRMVYTIAFDGKVRGTGWLIALYLRVVFRMGLRRMRGQTF